MKSEHRTETDVAKATPSDTEVNDCVTVGGPLWKLRWPSKEVDIGTPGELAVCGHSDDAEIPFNVARRLQLVDALKPLPGEPRVWVVPVERIVFGLLREASAKGISEPAEVETYVTRGLAECGDGAEPAAVWHLIDRCLAARLALQGVESSVLGMKQHAVGDTAPVRTPDTNAPPLATAVPAIGSQADEGSLSVTQAAYVTGRNKGVISRWRKTEDLAASDGKGIDRIKLIEVAKNHPPRKKPARPSGQGGKSTKSDEDLDQNQVALNACVWRYVEHIKQASIEDVLACVQRDFPGTEISDVARLLRDDKCYHPTTDGSGRLVYEVVRR